MCNDHQIICPTQLDALKKEIFSHDNRVFGFVLFPFFFAQFFLYSSRYVTLKNQPTACTNDCTWCLCGTSSLPHDALDAWKTDQIARIRLAKVPTVSEFYLKNENPPDWKFDRPQPLLVISFLFSFTVSCNTYECTVISTHAHGSWFLYISLIVCRMFE